MRKYDNQDVEWFVLEEGDDNVYLLKEREGFWIDKLQSFWTDNGYNMTQGGDSAYQWYKSLTDEEKELHRQRGLQNLSKTWDDPKRIEAVRQSWIQNSEDQIQQRKQAISKGSKRAWSDKEHRRLRMQRMSDAQKKIYSGGKRVPSKEHLDMACSKAKATVSGSSWYNDGVRSYRLQQSDDRIPTLYVGRLSWKLQKSV